MKGITDIDEGTLRRVDWQEIFPPVIFFRVFSAALNPFALALLSAVLAFVVLFGRFEITISPSLLSDQMQLVTPPFVVSMGLKINRLIALAILLFFWLIYARTAAVELTSTSRSSFGRSACFAFRKYRSVLLAMLIPFVAFLLCTLATMLFVFLCKVIPLFLPFVWLGCFGLLLSLLLLVFGLPLMVSAVAVDKSDGFDALARAVSYITQRPLHLIIYLFLATIPAGIGYKIIEGIVKGATSVYIGLHAHCGIILDITGIWWTFWALTVSLLPVAFLFLFSVNSSVAIYLMLRRSTDGTPMDEYKTDAAGRPKRRLPAMETDSLGAPILPLRSVPEEDTTDAGAV